MIDRGSWTRGITAILCLALAGFSGCDRPVEKSVTGFRDLVEELSEEGGYFDTDNLISNETAYIQLIDALQPVGGVYVGVGPEQNFHYIGRLRPSWAFILDIRRDNMLHHLLLNALLSSSESPYDYLCHLFSRACPSEPEGDGFEGLVATVESSPVEEKLFESSLKTAYDHIETRLEFALTEKDRGVLEYIFRAYFDEQLGLRFRSHGRAPMPHHPSYRKMLVAVTPEGDEAHFLSRPDDYAHVRKLALEGRMVPVVGNFAGPHALRQIGAFVSARGETISAFYVSNVEFYLIRNGQFRDYVENVRTLPLAEGSIFLRAYFSYGYPHPEALPGHRSTLVRQNMNRFLELYDEGAFANYWDVSTLGTER